MYLKVINNDKKAIFEVCDKEYGISLKDNSNKIIKYPIVEDYVSIIKHFDKNVLRIPTDIIELDNALGGGLSSGLYIIGANPGLGKTSLVLHILINLALKKQHAVFFNLEMSPFQIMTKLLANYSYRKSLEDDTFAKLTINELSSKSIFNDVNGFDDSSKKIIKSYMETIDPYINIVNRNDNNSLSGQYKNSYVEGIKTTLENYEKYHNIKPVVVIDFLQLLKLKSSFSEENTSKTFEKRLEVNEIVDNLKDYSSFYHVPIIVISSLSRSSYTKTVEDDDNMEYSLSIFKETGQIEYTGDFLTLLTRGQSITKFGEEDVIVVILNILKTRYSNYTGEKIQLEFIPEFSYFKEIKK